MALVALLCAPASGAPNPAHKGESPQWLLKEQPLPLAVQTNDDLAVKAQAERYYLIFNLLGHGKLAWDVGDFKTAAEKWDELLHVKDLDAETVKVIQPLVEKARDKAGMTGLEPPGPVVTTPKEPSPPPPPPKPSTFTVSGVISGGDQGPGGAVITLKPSDGRKLTLRPAKGKTMLQKGKSFLPHVLVVPVGTAVAFRNEDPLFHNVFSLSPSKKFDAGLFNQGEGQVVTFDTAGTVQVLCNIHASMLAYVVTVDTPLYATAGASGAFSIKDVPPGEYDIEVWHESASTPTKSHVKVSDDVSRLALTVGSDLKPNPFPPDKYNKPRQTQLGY